LNFEVVLANFGEKLAYIIQNEYQNITEKEIWNKRIDKNL